MAEVTYPNGYSGGRATIEQVFARKDVVMLHAEYQKRYRGLMIASKGLIGIGGAGRTTAQQEALFLSRHVKVGSGGCCTYKGQRYSLKHGYAHAAPPGQSFHEPVVQGKCAAVDAVGNLKWMALNCERYGLEQASWGNETWHYQFAEYPHSVAQWHKQGSPPPQKWTVPGSVTPPVTPPAPPTPAQWQAYGAKAKTPPGNPSLKRGVVHPNVQELQAVLCSMAKPPQYGGYCYPPEMVDKDKVGAGKQTDNLFGDQSHADLAWWQSMNALTADGIFGPKTSEKMTTIRGK